jgi:formimidoylglutamate deiminase
VFSGQGNPVRRVVVGGRDVVRDGRHLRREPIAARFAAAMRRLAA